MKIELQIEVTGGEVGRCLAEFVVRKEILNESGGLHGGFTALVVDNFTTYALITKESPPGVTVDLHVRSVVLESVFLIYNSLFNRG